MTLSGTVSRVEIKRGSAGADETIFRRGMLGEEGRTRASAVSSLGGARKRVGGISGGPAISTYFHGSDFSGPGVTVSAVFTSRGNYIKSFCKGREN